MMVERSVPFAAMADALLAWEMNGKSLEHRLVVGRIADKHPARQFGVQLAAQQFANGPARAFELVVAAEPAVDVNRADAGVHAFAAHDVRHPLYRHRRQVREFTVVDGDVGLASGAVFRHHGAGHLAHHALRHLPHAGLVAPPRGVSC